VLNRAPSDVAMKSPAPRHRSRPPRKSQARGSASDQPSWQGSAGSSGQQDGAVSIHLTPREREVLALICEGLSNKEIGRHLGIAPSTVKVHVSKILRALNVSTRLQAILATQCWNLLEERTNHHEHRTEN
jgi:DNA-binding NarL/FixJ family response regulator